MPKYDVKYVEWIMQLMQGTISLSTPIGSAEDTDAELGDMLEDPGPTPEELALLTDRHDLLNEYLNTYLTPRENDVIRMRFGFDCPQLTLQEIGDRFGICRERVRQIEDKALKKLRKKFIVHHITEDTI
ncbi:MAG: sigma-70 family RNA polymerase sigma factor [Bacteroidales bacterium]|nr:sigma-70 family RNA polymerase sigma factor [Bacteroidales bacterium]